MRREHRHFDVAFRCEGRMGRLWSGVWCFERFLHFLRVLRRFKSYLVSSAVYNCSKNQSLRPQRLKGCLKAAAKWEGVNEAIETSEYLSKTIFNYNQVLLVVRNVQFVENNRTNQWASGLLRTIACAFSADEYSGMITNRSEHWRHET